MTALASLLQAFFTDRLMTQYGASPHTIASYRDTFRLLLTHVHQQTGTLPTHLDLADLDASTIGSFLHYLETERVNSPATGKPIPNRCSPPAVTPRCPTTRSPTWSPSTPRSPPVPARPCAPSTSPRTPCDTPPR